MRLGLLLEREQIEARLRTAWQAKTRAELIGDTVSAGKQQRELDALLDALLERLAQR